MRTVSLEVCSREETSRRVMHAFQGKPQGTIFSFATPALLLKVLTQKRWELLASLASAGPVTIREAARRIERDVKAVLGDVHALLNAGVLQKNEGGKIIFPFDRET
ncbi:MAG: HVO_A0114 family putative DNA-binding protein [Acidiferrobacterales bacterium]